MNPELRDPERTMPTDPKTAVAAKAEQVESHIKAAIDGLKELQKLMGQVPASDLKPELAAQTADMRVSAMEMSQSLGTYLLLPIIVKVLYEGRQ